MPASPNVGNYRFPFKHIPDISPEAARQIRRNFESLSNLGGIAIFEAVIDPTLAAAEPTIHAYPNLTTLLATEVWPATHVFVIGVRPALTTSIKEPASVTLVPPGPLALVAMAQTGPIWENIAAANARQRWDLNGCTVTVPANTVITLKDIELANSAAGSIVPFTGFLHMENCRVQGSAGDGATTKISSPATSTVTAINTLFESCVFAANAFCWDCHLLWALSSDGTFNPSGHLLVWDGGTIAAAPSSTPGS